MLDNLDKLKEHLVEFLRYEVAKRGFDRVVLGISGGLDSAVTALLSKEAFKERVFALLMPSPFSNVKNLIDAKNFCSTFKIKYRVIQLNELVDAYQKEMQTKDKIRIGNWTARMRMALLFDLAVQKDSLVIGTSNKTEIYLGYGTIYGDTACALNPIGDIFKTELFRFAKYLNVPKYILDKKPTADLWKDQTDEDELGYSYANMDAVLKQVENGLIKSELIKKGFDSVMVDYIFDRVKKNRFKSSMPLIARAKHLIS